MTSKKFTRTTGLGLVEVLIAGAVLAVVMAGVARTFSQAFRSNRQLQTSMETADLVHQIRQTLRNPALCNCNLAPAAPSPITFLSAPLPASIPLNQGIRLYSASCATAGNVIAQATSTAPSGPVWVTALALTNLFSIDPNQYSATVRLAVTQNVDGNGNGFSTVKEIPVLLNTLTSGTTVSIQSCQSSGGVETARAIASRCAGCTGPGLPFSHRVSVLSGSSSAFVSVPLGHHIAPPSAYGSLAAWVARNYVGVACNTAAGWTLSSCSSVDNNSATEGDFVYPNGCVIEDTTVYDISIICTRAS